MNIIIIKEKLKDGLDAVVRIAGGESNLPILKNVLLSAEDNMLVLTATNLEIAISYNVLGKVIEKGSTTVPAITFAHLVNSLASERINLDTNTQNTLSLTTDNYHASLNTIPKDDFPIVPKIKNERSVLEIDGGILKDALRYTMVATQFSDIRPELNVILFSYTAHALTLVGTDSSRLSEKIIQKQHITAIESKDFQLLIPLRTAQELFKILRDDEKVSLSYDDNQVLFLSERFRFISRLSQGNFPDYQSIIPKKFDVQIIIEREELIQAMKLVSVFGTRSSEATIKIISSEKSVEIFSSDEQIGKNKYKIPAKIQGTDLEVSFNWKYIVDGIRELKTGEISFSLNGENAPAMIKSSSDSSFFYLLMPIIKS